MLSTEKEPAYFPSLSHFNPVSHADLVVGLPPMATQLPKVETILVIGGPAGSGKSTVASYLSQELGIPYIEGDDVRLLLLTVLLRPPVDLHSTTLPLTKPRWAAAYH